MEKSEIGILDIDMGILTFYTALTHTASYLDSNSENYGTGRLALNSLASFRARQALPFLLLNEMKE
jgi:hypothetical protein